VVRRQKRCRCLVSASFEARERRRPSRSLNPRLVRKSPSPRQSRVPRLSAAGKQFQRPVIRAESVDSFRQPQQASGAGRPRCLQEKVFKTRWSQLEARDCPCGRATTTGGRLCPFPQRDLTSRNLRTATVSWLQTRLERWRRWLRPPFDDLARGHANRAVGACEPSRPRPGLVWVSIWERPALFQSERRLAYERGLASLRFLGPSCYPCIAAGGCCAE